MINIQDIKKNIAALPPFQETILKARDMLSDPNVSAKELTEVLQYDVSITANILKVCNSAYYAPKIPIKNLQQAIVYLGHRELREILIIGGMIKYFDDHQPGFESMNGELLRHSVATAILAKELGIYLGKEDEILFVAGLLYDVGKIILGEYVKEQYDQIIDKVMNEGMQFHEAEQAILGINHGEVGRIVLEEWNFPAEIISAASAHHIDDLSEHEDVDLIVALADRMTSLMGAGTLNDGMYYEGFTKLCQYFGLHLRDIEQILSTAVKEIATVVDTFSKNVKV